MEGLSTQLVEMFLLRLTDLGGTWCQHVVGRRDVLGIAGKWHIGPSAYKPVNWNIRAPSLGRQPLSQHCFDSLSWCLEQAVCGVAQRSLWLLHYGSLRRIMHWLDHWGIGGTGSVRHDDEFVSTKTLVVKEVVVQH